MIHFFSTTNWTIGFSIVLLSRLSCYPRNIMLPIDDSKGNLQVGKVRQGLKNTASNRLESLVNQFPRISAGINSLYSTKSASITLWLNLWLWTISTLWCTCAHFSHSMLCTEYSGFISSNDEFLIISNLLAFRRRIIPTWHLSQMSPTLNSGISQLRVDMIDPWKGWIKTIA